MQVYPTSFYVFSIAVIPLWILMIVFPRWPRTERIMRSLWVVVPFILAYAILELPHLNDLPKLIKPDFGVVFDLFKSDQIVTLAWLHFIACDLFVGRWVYLDSRKHNFNVLVMAPVLFFCLALCPLGFTGYLIVRSWVLRGKGMDADA